MEGCSVLRGKWDEWKSKTLGLWGFRMNVRLSKQRELALSLLLGQEAGELDLRAALRLWRGSTPRLIAGRLMEEERAAKDDSLQSKDLLIAYLQGREEFHRHNAQQLQRLAAPALEEADHALAALRARSSKLKAAVAEANSAVAYSDSPPRPVRPASLPHSPSPYTRSSTSPQRNSSPQRAAAPHAAQARPAGTAARPTSGTPPQARPASGAPAAGKPGQSKAGAGPIAAKP
eukprot:2700052-Rhodomonas_salina.1